MSIFQMSAGGEPARCATVPEFTCLTNSLGVSRKAIVRPSGERTGPPLNPDCVIFVAVPAFMLYFQISPWRYAYTSGLAVCPWLTRTSAPRDIMSSTKSSFFMTSISPQTLLYSAYHKCLGSLERDFALSIYSGIAGIESRLRLMPSANQTRRQECTQDIGSEIKQRGMTIGSQ